jgi:EAL domain-containing protein (putative c-di-GMP-specific phosphodiesterase class I)
MTAIGEGVETRTQLEVLTRLGCQEYQGYYFSKPLPAEQFERVLAPPISSSVLAFKPPGN